MANIILPRGWELSENLVTPEHVFLNRREFLKKMGIVSVGAWSILNGFSGLATAGESDVRQTIPPRSSMFEVPRNSKFTADRPITRELTAASYNNFYEFTIQKDKVWKKARHFHPRPWKIEISGLVHKNQTLDIDDLLKKMPLEERIYRHRCVEAWSMVVPWIGFPLKKLIDLAQPTSQARYLRMVSFLRPSEAPGQKDQPWYPWPYFEGLTMAEASNDLAFIVTGIYGHALPNQHGAPLRLAVPWKYGFKSIKSIVKFEFVSEQPPTFWNKLVPDEYDFQANVNPKIPHPRWSQAMERDINTGKRIPTRLYNGYGEFVAGLYS